MSDDHTSTASASSSSPAADPYESAQIGRLLVAESHHFPLTDYFHRCRQRSIDVVARQDSIKWILDVNAHYQFKPVTAFLAINYLDRFLSLPSLPVLNRWAFQLISVACLSLAAKMEETQVPLLMDLQILVPRFVFGSETVQRMELHLMSHLHWRLRSVTPFDYLDYFILKLHISRPDPDPRIISASSVLILNTTRVIDFLRFSPSIIAAAAVLCAAGDDTDAAPEGFYEKVNKEMVRSCHQLMDEYLIDKCPLADDKHQAVEPQPLHQPSPDGVLLDGSPCQSCDTRSENAGRQTLDIELRNKRLQEE